jgi:hypothetical protein
LLKPSTFFGEIKTGPESIPELLVIFFPDGFELKVQSLIGWFAIYPVATINPNIA